MVDKTQYSRNLRASWKTAGVCGRCGKPRERGRKQCRKCLDYASAEWVKNRKVRIERGLCPRCGKPPEKDRRVCATCVAETTVRLQVQYAERVAAGICTECAKRRPAKGKLRCTKCLASNAVARNLKGCELRKQVFEALGAECACCGERQPKFLTLDHVKNDGAAERGGHRDWRRIYQRVVDSNFPRDRYQVLCFNCNCGKARNGGICPHKQAA